MSDKQENVDEVTLSVRVIKPIEGGPKDLERAVLQHLRTLNPPLRGARYGARIEVEVIGHAQYDRTPTATLIPSPATAGR